MLGGFEFATATRIVFGAGTLKQVGDLAAGFGRRALVVTGRYQGRATPLIENLKAGGLAIHVFSIAGEPELTTVQSGGAEARAHSCDLVISFGGGSAIDAGKAIAALLTNTGDLLDYLEIIGHGKSLTHTPAPFIAIPTTAGTGSEVTRNSVLASPQHRLKVSLRSPLMLPRLALIDPELTYDLPPATTASTGTDALTQLIEPFVCSRANPLTDALCVEGIGRAARSLPIAFLDGHNLEARQDMCVASLFGGLALANAGLGAVHGFAGPLGGMFPAPHGALCGALLPQVMAANIEALRQRQPQSIALQRYQQIAQLLTRNPKAAAEDGVHWVRQLGSDLQVPRLATYGIRRQHFPELVDKAAKASSMKANPIILSPEELAAILQQAL
jgi:alcohol dehydrogenase class IV